VFTAGTIIPIVIAMVCGATGGMAVARWAKGLGLAIPGNALTGTLTLTWLAGRKPGGVSRFVGRVERVADTAARPSATTHRPFWSASALPVSWVVCFSR
jgi:hypothetical protein